MHCGKRSLTEDETGEEGPSSSKQRCLNTPISSITFQNPPRTLFDNFNDLRINNTLCDWTIRTNDNQEIPAHILVLEQSSTYFQKEHLESLKTRTTTIDLPTGIVNLILDFWYTGKCKVNEENVLQLLKAASDHDFNDITQQCHRFIMQEIRPENCISMYHQTKRFLPEVLSEEVFKYILHNFQRVLHHMKQAFELDVETLVEILSSDYLNVGDEYVLYRFVSGWIEKDKSNREQHTLRLLNCLRLGRIEFFGFMEVCDIFGRFCTNSKQRYPNDILFVFGGKSPKRNGRRPKHPFVQVFDKCANKWFPLTNVGAPDFSQKQCGLGVLNNIVYLVGGIYKKSVSTEHNTYTNKVTCFDPEKRLWWESACMFNQRSELCVVTCDGLLYAIGGSLQEVSLNSAERYDPCTNQWSRTASLNESRRLAGSAELHGKIYVAGGEGNTHTLNSVEVYFPETDQWTFIEPMGVPRYGLCCVAYGDAVYAIGGADHYNQVERYEAEGKEPKWEDFSPMNERRRNFTAVIIDDAIFAIGGIEKSGWHFEYPTMTTEKFSFGEERRNYWKLVDSMICRIYNHTACVISGLKNAKEYSYEEYCARKEATSETEDV